MGFKIDDSNIFKSKIGKKEKLTLEDIANCTGGGKGIGAAFSRNLSRIMALRKREGWITGSKIPDLIGTAEKTENIDALEKIQKNFETKLTNIKNKLSKEGLNNLSPLKTEANKIAQLSTVLKAKIPEDTKSKKVKEKALIKNATRIEAANVSEALILLSELKKLDPLLLLAAPGKFGIHSELTHDFQIFLRMKQPPPQSNPELQKAYKEFLQSQFSSIKPEEPLNYQKLVRLESYADQKVIEDIYRSYKLLNPELYANELVSESIGPVARNIKTNKAYTTETFYEYIQGESLIYNSILSSQIQHDLQRHMQDIIYINKEWDYSERAIPKIADDTRNYADFVPKSLKEFAGNDENKIRMIAAILTQNGSSISAEHLDKKYAIKEMVDGKLVSTLEEKIACSSVRYDFEIFNGQRQVRITSNFDQKFADGKTPSRSFVVTNYLNLDNPHAPVYIEEREIFALQPVTSALAKKDATYATDGSGIVDFAYVNKEIGFGYVGDGTGHDNPKMAKVLSRLFDNFNRQYQAEYQVQFADHQPSLEECVSFVKKQLTILGNTMHIEPEAVQDENPKKPGVTHLDEPTLKPAFSFAQIVNIGKQSHLISAQFGDTILLIKREDGSFDTSLAQKRPWDGLGDDNRPLNKEGVCQITPLNEGDEVYGFSDGIGEFLTMEELQKLITDNKDPNKLMSELKEYIVKKGESFPLDEHGRKEKVELLTANGVLGLKGHDPINAKYHDDISLIRMKVA